ncbi:MAG: protease pro-enzyme activation domain-containing protein [Thermoplasmata archaeon]
MGRGVVIVALVLSMTVGFGIGTALVGGPALPSGSPPPGFSVSSVAQVPGAGWNVAQLAASAPVSVPYPEVGMGLAGANYLGSPHFASAANPLGTTEILVSLDVSNGTQLDRLLSALSDPSSPEYHHYLTHAQFDSEFGADPAVYRSLTGYFSSFGVTQLTTHPDRLSVSFQASPAQVASIFHADLGAFVSPAGQSYFAPRSLPELPSLVAPYVSEVQGFSNFSEYLTHTDSEMVTQQLLGSVGASVTGASASGPIGGDVRQSPIPPGTSSNPFTPTTVNGRTYDEPVHFGSAGTNCAASTCGQMVEGADLQVAYNETGLFAKYGYPVNATVVAMLWSDPVCTANSSTCKTDGLYNTFCKTLTSGSYAWDFFEPDVTTFWNYTLPSGEPMPRAVPMPVSGASSYAYPAGSRGYSASCDNGGAQEESTLDVAMEGSVAPGANVLDVFGQGATTTVLTTEFADILSPSASEFSTAGGFDTPKDLHYLSNTSVIANSWGGGSFGGTPAWISDLKEAQALGITVLASTGDSGNNALEGPAENAYNTYGDVAVGGSTLVVNPTTLVRTADHLFSSSAPYDGTGGGEIVWYGPAGKVAGFGSTLGSVGGVTTSATNYAPKWQNSSVDAHGVIAKISTGRGVPDVSAIANDTIVDVEVGYFSANITCTVTASCTKVSSLPGSPAVEHGWTYFVGTSVSAQVAGGIVGMIDYVLHKAGEGKVGFLDPAAYAAGQLQYTSDLTLHSFKDITLFHNAEPAGTYGAFAGWDADSGWGAIDAGNYTRNALTSPFSFFESGLPSGTKWSVTVTPKVGDVGCVVSGSTCTNPVTSTATTPSITFNEPFGSYAYKLGLVAGYSPSPTSGTFKMNGAAGLDNILFSPVTYTLKFTETGLPTGTSWSVTVNSNHGSSTGSSISFQEPNGTASYTVGTVSGYTASPSSGTVTVNGAPVSLGIAFSSSTYSVAFSESRLPSGASFQVTVNGAPQSLTANGGTDTLTFPEPNGTYGYTIANVPGWHQATLPASGSVTVLGASVTEPTLAYTQVTYAVTFAESGLPSGTHWSVTLNGNLQSSTGSSIPFTVPNGTYGYTISNVPGWHQSTLASSGSLTVNGASVTEPTLAYTQVTYLVTFTETGLSGGTHWSVTLNGNLQSSTGTSIAFAEPNGTFGFTVGGISGYAPSPSSGSVTVNGAAASVPVTFGQVTYSVTFAENGLPSGQTFGVTLNGVLRSVVTDGGTDTVAFTMPNGTYSYSISNVPGWHQTTLASTGSVAVNGGAVTEPTLAYGQVTYAVSFTESGLPSGTHWSVTFHGSTLSSTTASILFAAPNGTFGYTVGGISGYSPSPTSGSVTVNGAGVLVPVTFTQVTYSVTFSESGLPSGQTFRVVVNGVAKSLTTNGGTDSLTFTEPNGTYGYAISNVPGWHQATLASSGSVGVSGASVTEPTLAYTQVTYPVTFTESGLPTGTHWAVTLNGGTLGSTTTSIVFAEPNGTFGYTVGGIPGYGPAPSSGSVTVNGAGAAAAIAFSPETYSVMFLESGLPTGTLWSVTLNGNTLSSTGTTIAFSETNGTYGFTVGGVAGYRSSPSSGSVTVAGAGVSPAIAFTPWTYSVTFSESGLPSGTTFEVTLNGVPRSVVVGGGSNSLIFAQPNGTYGYTIANVPGWHQATLSASGSVVVNGASVTEPTLAYTQVTYPVTFAETGLPSGTHWSVTLNGNLQSSTGSSIPFTEPNGTYGYTISNVPGWHQSTLASSGSLTVNGASVTEPTLTFTQVTYTVTFTESGLPTGTHWSVTLNGNLQSSTGTSIAYAEPNGTFGFTVGGISGYAPSPSSGSVTVNGAGASTPITFTQVTYPVTFTETGLPGGTLWSITLSGNKLQSTGASIMFTEPNGTFGYTVGGISGYSPSPMSGSVTVNGAGVLVPVTFTQVTYSVTFSESGLPSGQTFRVVVNGVAKSLTTNGGTDSLTFTEPNGTYGYAISNVPGWHQATLASSGSVGVSGASVTEPTLAYTQVTYPVTFTESGLAPGTTWSVVLNGHTLSAATTTIQFIEPNGTYSYVVPGVAGTYRASPNSGSVTVSGAGAATPIAFTQATFPVTFTETGLPSGTMWSVTLNGQTLGSTSSSIVFAEPNGTYAYAVPHVAGYGATPSSGSVSVAGSGASVSVRFTAGLYTVTFSETGLPSGMSWSVTLGGTVRSSTGTTIAFTVANGTYSYTVAVIPGYLTNHPIGSVTVNGAPVLVALSFLSILHSVTIAETGLPSGREWAVAFNGTGETSTSASISFTGVPNGTYTYLVHSEGAFRVAGLAPEGTIVVSGSGVTEAVTFVRGATYSIAFHELGLGAGTPWCLTIGSTVCSTTKVVVPHLTPGIYAYAVLPIGDLTTLVKLGSVAFGANGSTVIAHGVTFQVRFAHAVTFTETGLPSGSPWKVSAGGSHTTAAAATIVLYLSNGTYSFTAGHAAGYTASPASGRLTVAGAPIGISVRFAAVRHSLGDAALGPIAPALERAIDLLRSL